MILPLTLFIISGLSIISLLVHKKLELSHGKGLVVLDTLSDFDHKVTGTTDKIKNYLSLVNKNNTFKLLNGVFIFIVRVALAIIEWIRDHIHALYEKAERRKPKLGSGASASVYLKRISEIKEENKGN